MKSQIFKTSSLAVGLSLVSCGAAFYNRYAIFPDHWDGVIVNEKGEERPLADCKPGEDGKNKCALRLLPDEKALQKDHESCEIQLKDCQKKCHALSLDE